MQLPSHIQRKRLVSADAILWSGKVQFRSLLVIDVLRAGVTVVLHYMEVDDDTCRGRLHLRNRRTEHQFCDRR